MQPQAGDDERARIPGPTADRVDYDEFSMFHENAAEFGLPYSGPPIVHRVATTLPDGRVISSLVWGDAPPELVLLHGGGQNAHTWDTVALALGKPLVALDLPGHGHSDGPSTVGPSESGLSTPESFASDMAVAIANVAPEASAVVGMSLGGLTSIALSALAPNLVRRLALVDITPGVTAQKSAAIANFVRGPATFASLDALLARTIEHNPGRSISSLRRGILHNAVQLDDGSWMWRYRRFGTEGLPGMSTSAGTETSSNDSGFSRLWQALASTTAPLMLARGMKTQSVVDDADVVELLRRRPDCQVIEFPEAGHSVQGDSPVELAQALDRFIRAT